MNRTLSLFFASFLVILHGTGAGCVHHMEIVPPAIPRDPPRAQNPPPTKPTVSDTFLARWGSFRSKLRCRQQRGSGARNHISHNALNRGNDANYTYHEFAVVDETYQPEFRAENSRNFVPKTPDLVMHVLLRAQRSTT